MDKISNDRQLVEKFERDFIIIIIIIIIIKILTNPNLLLITKLTKKSYLQ